LSFKGDKKAKKKKKRTKHKPEKENPETLTAPTDNDEEEEDMTPAERRAMRRKRERERQELAKVAQKSHRERVEEFNEKLGKLTEHNDIPRVSTCILSLFSRVMSRYFLMGVR